MENWYIFRGTNEKLPPAPRWRQFKDQNDQDSRAERRLGRGQTFQAGEMEIRMVNAALYLRRPLLVTGKPGTGKSSLAFAVAHELNLGNVLYWPITTRSTLQQGLYQYDAIGRLQESQLARMQRKKEIPNIGRFIRLGPLGTALLPSEKPRVLLIDEIDKSDIDLPNDLLNIFEEGRFEIPELSRLPEEREEVSVFLHDSEDKVAIRRGKVVCQEFPFVVLTSNAERELPAPFLRRCLRLDIDPPDDTKLAKIVQAHFGDNAAEAHKKLIDEFIKRRDGDKDKPETKSELATDQLLNAIYLTIQGVELPFDVKDKKSLIDAVLNPLST